MFFINAIYWLWLFIIPSGLFSFLGFWIYVKNNNNLPYAVFLGLVGITLGIVIAEFVRKKYGLDNFFGRISATPDIDGENILDKKTKD